MAIKNWKSSGGGGDYENELTWRPEGEDELTGVLVGKATVDTKHGPCVVLKIETEAGEVYNVWCSRSGIKKLVEDNDDQLILGREIGIRTKEAIKLKNNNDFVPYELGFGDQMASVSAGRSAVAVDDEEPF